MLINAERQWFCCHHSCKHHFAVLLLLFMHTFILLLSLTHKTSPCYRLNVCVQAIFFGQKPESSVMVLWDWPSLEVKTSEGWMLINGISVLLKGSWRAPSSLRPNEDTARGWPSINQKVIFLGITSVEIPSLQSFWEINDWLKFNNSIHHLKLVHCSMWGITNAKPGHWFQNGFSGGLEIISLDLFVSDL